MPTEMSTDQIRRIKLEVLRQDHRDLDAAVKALSEQGGDMLAIQRLKKKKLTLKDQISQLENQLTPDIIA